MVGVLCWISKPDREAHRWLWNITGLGFRYLSTVRAAILAVLLRCKHTGSQSLERRRALGMVQPALLPNTYRCFRECYFNDTLDALKRPCQIPCAASWQNVTVARDSGYHLHGGIRPDCGAHWTTRNGVLPDQPIGNFSIFFFRVIRFREGQPCPPGTSTPGGLAGLVFFAATRATTALGETFRTSERFGAILVRASGGHRLSKVDVKTTGEYSRSGTHPRPRRTSGPASRSPERREEERPANASPPTPPFWTDEPRSCRSCGNFHVNTPKQFHVRVLLVDYSWFSSHFCGIWRDRVAFAMDISRRVAPFRDSAPPRVSSLVLAATVRWKQVVLFGEGPGERLLLAGILPFDSSRAHKWIYAASFLLSNTSVFLT